MSQVFGLFVEAMYWDEDTKGWNASLVKLSEIKTVQRMEKEKTQNYEACSFYTYKDSRYYCYMDYHDLVKAINAIYLIDEKEPKKYDKKTKSSKLPKKQDKK